MWTDLQDETATCAFCPNLCLHACVVSNTERRSTVAPWAKMSAVHWGGQGAQSIDTQVAELAFKCTECGACTDACVRRIDVAATLRRAREQLVARGMSPFSVELFAESVPDPAAWNAIAPITDATRTVYAPGCQAPDLDQAALAVKLFEQLGFGPVGLASQCCGAQLGAGGYRSAAHEQRARFLAGIPAGARVVVGAGACLAHLREAEVDTEFVPIVEALRVGVLRAATEVRRVRTRVAVFDGCQHLRRLAQRQPTRELVDRLVVHPAEELRWAAQESHCCGAGGGLTRTSPDTAAGAAQRIGRQAEGAGVDALVVFDSGCAAHLRRSLGASIITGVELVARALGCKPEEA